jgi:hypothetical protein
MSLWDRHSTQQCDPLSCWYCLHANPDHYCNLWTPEQWARELQRRSLHEKELAVQRLRKKEEERARKACGECDGVQPTVPESPAKAPNSPVEPLSEGE